jgi:hypothetical protein
MTLDSVIRPSATVHNADELKVYAQLPPTSDDVALRVRPATPVRPSARPVGK